MRYADKLSDAPFITAESGELIAHHRVDFRKRFDGLLAQARQLGADPYAGDLIMFVKRDFTQLRLLASDSLGLYLISRRFEGARLRKFFEFAVEAKAVRLSRAELSLLLEGAHFTVHARAKPWRAPAPEPIQAPSAT